MHEAILPLLLLLFFEKISYSNDERAESRPFF